MTIKPNLPQDSFGPKDAALRFGFFPVGGTDPDFVSRDSSKSPVCAIPLLGKVLPQCR